MKSIAIVALTAMISIPSSVFAWGPRGGAVVVRPSVPRTVVGRPFFPRFVVGRTFVRAPSSFARSLRGSLSEDILPASLLDFSQIEW